MSTVPAWLMALMYWLHMLATIAWLGGLISMSLLVLPAARKTLAGEMYAAFLGQITRRLQQIGWLSLVVLTGTGMFQMSSNPAYSGFLEITNHWATAIFLKHILIVLMVGLSAYVTWGLTPTLQRLALLKSKGKGDPQVLEKMQRREIRLVHINLVISILVLLLTAWARVSG